MKILILGGTRFLGRWLDTSAAERGHTLTLFHRGRTNPDIFPGVEKLTGDRDGNLNALQGRKWDAVIDTSGYVPRIVRQSVSLLKDQVDHYTFISSISVYADMREPGIDEEGQLEKLPEDIAIGSPESENIQEYYGALKVLCEREVQQVYGNRALIIRPGLIVGPHDPTDRFSYWPLRISQGGQVLAPGKPENPVQFIDVRDLADWTVRMVEKKAGDVYNATGLMPPVSMGQLLDTCKLVSSKEASIEWVEESFLLEKGVQPWMELPLWLPGEEYRGMEQVSVQRALERGLRFRPLRDTISDTLDWLRTRPAEYEWRAGMKPEREAELLKEWHSIEA